MFFEGIDVNKTSELKECIICHYWFFLDKGIRFRQAVWNECDDVLMMSTVVNSITILNMHGVDYHCMITGITKIEVIELLRNSDLSEKMGLIIEKISNRIIFLVM